MLNQFKFRKTRAVLTALLCGLWAFSFSATGSELNQIQQQIKQQQSKVEVQKREKAKLQTTLKNQENKINEMSNALRETEIGLNDIRQQLRQSDQQINLLEKQVQEQKTQLAAQMDAIYRAGINPSMLKRLAAVDPQKAERMKFYYQHLNQTRIELINRLQATEAQLKQQKQAMLEQQKTQKTQLSAQKKQQQELQKAQKAHQTTLNTLNQHLTQDEKRLERLKTNENALRQEIKRAEQAVLQQEKKEREALSQKQKAEEQRTAKPYQPTAQERQLLNSANGLGVAKGQYAAPVKGAVLHAFGTVQMGEVRWKGMVIGAAEGTNVKAIADGRVILAGHLNGYGNMVIIEHGDSDLSLYGFNRTILVKPEQLVSAGQTIAQIGNTGDLARPALYFGISRKGMPMNPAGWIK